MICLEMIGCFKDEKNSQIYPSNFLKYIYGNKGNFITIIKKLGDIGFSSQFAREFKRLKLVKTKVFPAPKFMWNVVDYSDHKNYWKHGMKAFMITDTAFYRNKNYHTDKDTIDKLDIPRMAAVIESVVRVLILNYGSKNKVI